MPVLVEIISSLSTPFIRLITVVVPDVFLPAIVSMLSSAPSSAPYFRATISKSTPFASSGVHTFG